MLISKIALLTCLNVDHANDSLLRNQRYGEFGANQRVRVDVARLLANVIDQYRAALLHGHSRNSLAYRNLHALNVWSVPDVEPDAQLMGALVQQQDGEDFVFNHLTHKLSHAAKELVHLERAVERVRDVNEEVLELERN